MLFKMRTLIPETLIFLWLKDLYVRRVDKPACKFNLTDLVYYTHKVAGNHPRYWEMIRVNDFINVLLTAARLFATILSSKNHQHTCLTRIRNCFH